MAVLIDGLESAFARFGGVPAELLFDQMRTVVLSDDRTEGGELVLNAEFVRFSAHWGFVARSCRAQTQGKVEPPIRYLRDSFFYARTFASDEDLKAQASSWLEDTANVRVHGTTGERPVDRSNATSAGPCGRWRRGRTADRARCRLTRRRNARGPSSTWNDDRDASGDNRSVHPKVPTGCGGSRLTSECVEGFALSELDSSKLSRGGRSARFVKGYKQIHISIKEFAAVTAGVATVVGSTVVFHPPIMPWVKWITVAYSGLAMMLFLVGFLTHFDWGQSRRARCASCTRP